MGAINERQEWMKIGCMFEDLFITQQLLKFGIIEMRLFGE
jgi:hypothetical protein